MSSTFFTTNDGDMILRAAKHDFRVHERILSRASPIFRDMIAIPLPPDYPPEENQLPVIEVLDPPEVMDGILRFIYSEGELPEATELSMLATFLSAVIAYRVESICPTLREALKAFLPRDSFVAYILATRLGFLEEAKEAAKVSRTSTFHYYNPAEHLQHISSTSLFRLIQFVQQREHQGLLKIRNVLGPSALIEFVSCDHGEEAKDYYFRLEKTVEEAFVEDPCISPDDLVAVFDRVPNLPPGCKPLSRSGQWYYAGDEQEAVKCPLQSTTIRGRLADLADGLAKQSDGLLEKFFGKDVWMCS